jgi:hypothetical protein
MPKTKTEAGNGIHWDSLQETLDSGDTAKKGQQQFITPLAYATAFSSILPAVYRAVDLQIGTGNLLLGSGGDDFMGCDIDKGVARKPANAKGNWNAFPADITLFAPILAEIAWQADTFVLNPPFSINWDAKRLEFLGKSKSKEIRESYAMATVAVKSGSRRINSGVATFLMALEFMSTKGEGYIILSETIARKYFGNPEGYGGDLAARQHIWLWLSIPGSIFQNCNSIDTAVLYFARDHRRDGKIEHRTAKTNTPSGAEAALSDIRTNRYMIRAGIERKFKTDGSLTTWRDWNAARDEYEARYGERKRPFNIWIDEHQVIHRHLTPFQTLSGRVPQKLVQTLNLLEGQTPMALVVQRNTREALQAAVNSDVWLVDPKLPPLVEESIRLYHASRAPFYPLSEVQRIGYVDENETLKCRKNLGNSFTGYTAFEAGKSYKIASETVKIGRHKTQTNIDGDEEDILVTGQDLVITVTDESGTKHRFMQFPEMELDIRPDGTERRPNDLATNLSALIESFEIPEVQDVATIRHEEYRAMLAKIDELAARWGLAEKGVTIKNFQKDDLARSTLMYGAILAWAAGLGKTWAEIIRPFLMGSKRVLIVAPDTLHQQTKDVALKFFGVKIRSLMSQDEFYDDEILQAAAIARLNNVAPSTVVIDPRISPEVHPRIHALLDKPCDETWDKAHSIMVNPEHRKIGGITGKAGDEVWGHRTDMETHEQTVNAYPVTLWQCIRALDPSYQSGKPGGWLRIPTREEVLRILRATGMATEVRNDAVDTSPGDPQFWITSYTALGMNGADEWEPELVKRNGVQTLEISETITRRRWQTEGWQEEYGQGIGKELNGIRCIFTPTLSRLVADVFDCVEVDEGVRLKSTDSYISTGVRGLNPKTRLVLSATPIKNRLEDIFWLAKWVDGCTDDATARFPYANSSEAKEQFANEHQLKERNLTREAVYYANTGKSRRFEKRSAEICNIHRLWKLLGPIVIRRRKEDVGEDIAPKIFKPLHVKAGRAQQTVYGFHLNNPPEFTRAGEELKKSARVAVQLNLLRQAALCPDSQNLRDYHNDSMAASWTDFTTKSAAILGALIDPLSRGKQALIASPFQHFNATMYQRLRDAGVRACLCDGTVSATKRGEMAIRFKKYHYSVMVAGEKAMGEGNSFEQCNYLFLPSLDWAFDINDQTTDRIHRLTSKEDVYIFGCVTENTVDERLFTLYSEKGDSAHLALDGRLFTERIEEVNLAKLLSDAVKDFDPARETIDEHQIEAEWPYLKQKLSIAEQQFREFHPPIASCIGPKRFANSPFNPMVTPQDIKEALQALVSPNRKKNQKPLFVDPDETPESAEIRRLLEKLNNIQMPKE